MSFKYHYDCAKSHRITKYDMAAVRRYLSNTAPSRLSGLDKDEYSRVSYVKAPDWMVDRIVSAAYAEAPHLRGQLPDKWCKALSRFALSDNVMEVVFEFSTQYLPLLLNTSQISKLFTVEEVQPFGLYKETVRDYGDVQTQLLPLIHFLCQFSGCVPIVMLERNPWMIDRLPRELLRAILDGYSNTILDAYRLEFDSLPKRKDRAANPPDAIAPALMLLDILKLKEH